MYPSLEARMADSFLTMFPPFVPDEKAAVSVPAQEEFYRLMRALYELAAGEPLLFVSELHDDDVYPDHFNQAAYGKPTLRNWQRKFTKAVNETVKLLYSLGRGEEVKMNRRQKEIIARLGLEKGELPEAGRWMASRSDTSFEDFAHCFFDKQYPYLSKLYGKLLGEASWEKLESWLTAHGYQQHIFHETTASDCTLILSYANPAWGSAPPASGYLYKIKHTGISILYEPWFKDPCSIGVCIPNGMKLYLEHFSEMPDKLQKFILTQNKHCDGCRYCVQTDKTGTRPLACLPIETEKGTQKLCPYFPGFSFCWFALDDDLAENITAMLDFMDRFAK